MNSEYINLYTNSKRDLRRCRVTLRGSKRNDWIFDLKVNDKVDVRDDTLSPSNALSKMWHIGTITRIQRGEKHTVDSQCRHVTLSIHYDGWKSRWDEIVAVSEDKPISNKLRPLHRITPV